MRPQNLLESANVALAAWQVCISIPTTQHEGRVGGPISAAAPRLREMRPATLHGVMTEVSRKSSLSETPRTFSVLRKRPFEQQVGGSLKRLAIFVASLCCQTHLNRNRFV